MIHFRLQPSVAIMPVSRLDASDVDANDFLHGVALLCIISILRNLQRGRVHVAERSLHDTGHAFTDARIDVELECMATLRTSGWSWGS